MLRVYAHILGEGQRREHLTRLAAAEDAENGTDSDGGRLGDTWSRSGPKL